MPGRKYEAQSGYRYGFNGKEKDKDLNSLTAYDYGFRVYNPGIGKFLSVDPLMKNFAFYTPYSFAGNKPIWAFDIDGLEECGYGQRLENQWIPALASGKMTEEQYERNLIATAVGGGIGSLILVETVVTKGKISKVLLASQFFGLFEHNRAKTPEGRKAQDQRIKENFNDFVLNAGGGIILGKTARGLGILIKEAKDILKTSFLYGEASVKTQVGREMVEIGKGGIGSGGYLEIEIDVKVGFNNSKVASGEVVFEEIFKTVKTNATNGSINGIRGIWTYGDNLTTFNKLITDKVNKGLMTIEDAALQTFTGKMAQKNGFNKVQSISGEKNSDGTYKFVTSIIFGK